MAKYVIEHVRDECVGCGVCVSLCPDNWEMAEDGKSRALNTELDDLGCNMEAAQSCPTGCIKIYELKDGEKVQIAP